MLGSIGPLKVMLIVQGVWLVPGDPADGVEVDRRCALARRLGDAGDLGRMQVDVLVGTDVDERIAAVADPGTCRPAGRGCSPGCRAGPVIGA